MLIKFSQELDVFVAWQRLFAPTVEFRHVKNCEVARLKHKAEERYWQWFHMGRIEPEIPACHHYICGIRRLHYQKTAWLESTVDFREKLQGIAILPSGYALHSLLPHILWLAGAPAAYVLDHL